jgi:MYXO-CTERM domain-containing protein
MAKSPRFSNGALVAVIAASLIACVNHALDTDDDPATGTERQAATVPPPADATADAPDAFVMSPDASSDASPPPPDSGSGGVDASPPPPDSGSGGVDATAPPPDSGSDAGGNPPPDAGNGDVDSGTSDGVDAGSGGDGGTTSSSSSSGGTTSSSSSSGGSTSSSSSGGPSYADAGPKANSSLNPNLSITPGVGSSDEGCSAVPGSSQASTGAALGFLIAFAAFLRKRRSRSGS